MSKDPKGTMLILYDYMQVSGGAERVTLILAKNFPQYQIVVSRTYSEAKELIDVSTRPIRQLGNFYTRWLTRIPEAILNFKLKAQCVSEAKTVLYSGFYAPFAVHLQKRGRRIYYCHSVPRYAYDLYDASRSRYPLIFRWIFDLFVCVIRNQYKKSIEKMDVVLANSDNVEKRLNRYLGVSAKVVYPPVLVSGFKWLGDDGYYVSVARLTENKRVDIVVRAFLNMPQRRLVVVSGGPELDRLKMLAENAPNIDFVGWQSEQSLRTLIGKAKAAIYLPVDEDFGMSPVECMAAGKPIIGVASGGILETVIHGRTGVLVEEPPTPEAVQAAVLELDDLSSSTLRTACENRAKEFDESKFINAMSEYLFSSDV